LTPLSLKSLFAGAMQRCDRLFSKALEIASTGIDGRSRNGWATGRPADASVFAGNFSSRIPLTW